MLFSSEVPIEPPACWPVLTSAEATPAPAGPTPDVPAFIDVETTKPRPAPTSSSGGRMTEA
jgi:hypothetical protein